jgi:hypothetical protein
MEEMLSAPDVRHPAGLIAAMTYRRCGQVGGNEDGPLIRIDA